MRPLVTTEMVDIQKMIDKGALIDLTGLTSPEGMKDIMIVNIWLALKDKGVMTGQNVMISQLSVIDMDVTTSQVVMVAMAATMT